MKWTVKSMLLALMLTLSVVFVQAASVAPGKGTKARVAAMSEEQKLARLEKIKVRAEEMKDMDKSQLSRAEKKALRKEARELKKEAKEMKGGVYLSVGAIIIIILLLILIL